MARSKSKESIRCSYQLKWIDEDKSVKGHKAFAILFAGFTGIKDPDKGTGVVMIGDCRDELDSGIPTGMSMILREIRIMADDYSIDSTVEFAETAVKENPELTITIVRTE
jgi:hypothetical protein